MKTISTILKTFTLLFAMTKVAAQDQQGFNQNSSRGNFTSSVAPGFNFSFSPVFSTSLNSKSDSLLFRGSGGGIKFGGDYFFGKAGIGLSSGFGSSTPDNSTINKFLQKTNIPLDQLVITKSNQQNMYLLLGPSFRFGNTVELLLHAKGGLFINSSGLVMIQQKGAVRTMYRNESTNKSFYPGFQTGLNIQYHTRSDVWSFGIGADYLGTKSEVNNYDARRGGGIEGLKLSKNISDLVAGITIRYNIHSPRDQQTGLATGRLLPTVNKREASTGMATGRVLPTVNKRESSTGMATGRVLPTVNKKEIAIDEQGVHRIAIDEQGVHKIAIDEPGTHRMASQSCGPVTVKTTNENGTTTETTFSCPDDAIDYAQKIDPKKQKQWLPSNFRTVSNIPPGGIISGRVSWLSSNAGTGIVTNRMMMSGTTSMSGSSGKTSISDAAGSRGPITGIYAREVQSGKATGRTMYEPLFVEGSNIANDSRMGTVKSNPLYIENNNTGVNPLFEHKSNLRTAADEDCDGVEGLDVFLLDPNSRTAVAKTTTGSCGDFWFANVPEGAYIVKIAGALKGKKGYDVSFSKDGKYDIAGEIRTPDDPWAVFINTDNSHSNEKTAINNSHSNIKNLILLEADLDGDGEFESLKAQGSFSDGSTRDITSDIRTSSANKNIMFGAEALSMRRRVEVLKSNKLASSRHLTSITVTAGDLDGDGIGDTRAIATFSDGSTEDVTDALTINTSHSNIKQFSITVADLDGDGEADAILKTKTKSNQSNDRVATGDLNGDGATEGIIKTKTKSNQSNDRVAVGDINGDGVTEAIIKTKTKSNQSNDRVAVGDVNGDGVNEAINTSHSNLKTLRVSAGDADGDGIPDVVVGSGFSNSSKTFFETGDKSTQEQRMPGDPIPGIDVKLGRNGTDIKTTSTNSYGEFEFKNLDAGNYHVTISNDYYVSDETLVVVDRADENKTVVRGWDPVKKESITGRVDNNNNVQKAQNNNTVRSNRSEFGMSMIEADLDGDGEFESSYLSANGEVASITIDEAGTAKLIDKRAGGIKQTMQTQVLMSGDTKSNVGPVKWTAPESGNKRVWGDPHVDEKDGSLKLGEGNFGTVYKGKWRSSDVAIKPVRCSDGSCRIITDKAEDYPDASGLSLNGLPPGTPIDNAAVWFTDDRGKIYKSMTDGNGRVSLNGLPPGIPLKMIVNIGVDGSEDIIMKVSGSGGGSAGSIYLMKARHDIAMNAIRNMKG